MIALFNINSFNAYISRYEADLLFLDPPFEIWKDVPLWKAKTIVAFTNLKNRKYVLQKYGEPRTELIWHFKDGRWVSHNLPRITHEYILIYGEVNNVYVGEKNTLKPQKKGKGCVGRDKLPERVYYPRPRKALNSVLEYPRNVRTGCWTKPLPLIHNLIEWLTKEGDWVIDPFAGKATVGSICRKLHRSYIGFEIDKKVCNTARLI